MSVGTYRKRPVEIQAVRWTGQNMGEIAELAGDAWPGHVALADPRCGWRVLPLP